MNKHLEKVLEAAPGIFDTPGVEYTARYHKEYREYCGDHLTYTKSPYVEVNIMNRGGRIIYAANVEVPPDEADEFLDLLDQKKKAYAPEEREFKWMQDTW